MYERSRIYAKRKRPSATLKSHSSRTPSRVPWKVKKISSVSLEVSLVFLIYALTECDSNDEIIFGTCGTSAHTSYNCGGINGKAQGIKCCKIMKSKDIEEYP